MDKYINANSLIQDIEKSRKDNNHNNAIASQTHNAEHGHFIKMVLDQPTADVVPRNEVSNDLWKMRTHLIELYHKYRNKADEHGLTEEKQMFYQGRAEAIWEGIKELDELRKKYKTYEETSKKYFTAEEVAAMSQTEVRKNYADILRSMKDWNL